MERSYNAIALYLCVEGVLLLGRKRFDLFNFWQIFKLTVNGFEKYLNYNQTI